MDLIDKKILCELDLDCRIPLSKISKKLKIGRNVAAYRIKRLEKEGIIRKYISSINLGLLGYKTYRIYFKIQQSGSHKEFIKYLLENKKIIHCLKTEGYFDYTAAVAIKSINELDEVLMELRSRFNKIIKDYLVSILVYTKIFKLNKLLLNQKEDIIKFRKYSSEDKNIKIDEKDIKILKELAQSANIPIIKLTKKTGLSIDTVKYRLKILNKTLISSNRIILDLNKLGYYHYVIMLKMKQFTKYDGKRLDSWCSLKKNVLYYGKRIGNFDFEINVAIKDIEDLNSFLSELRSEFGGLLDSYELIINSRLLKLNYLPF